MAKEEIEVYLKNLALKKEFLKLDLDISPIFEYSRLELDLENRRLHSLLEFVNKYLEFGSRKKMEVMGYLFPPIFPGISPESDWYRFELWMQGKRVRKKLKEQLPDSFFLKNPEKLTGDELVLELNHLADLLAEIGYYISMQSDLPPRLLYNYMLETLEEEMELDNEGGWFLGGCSGYCPGCIQRPWCETGQDSCWPEDEEAGKMFLPDELKDYVSASPVSLALLRISQDNQESNSKRSSLENEGDFFAILN